MVGIGRSGFTWENRRMNRPRFAIAAAFVAGYLLLDWVSYIHPMQQFSITPWNPQPALAIALLILLGQRWLPAVFVAVLAAEWAVRGAPGPWPATVVVSAVISLGYAAIARALNGRFAVSLALDSQRDALRLVAVVTVGALVTGMLYVAALLASGVGPLDKPFEALIRFWIGDAVGILVTLPFLFMLAVPARRSDMRRMLGNPAILGPAAATAPHPEQLKYFYVLFLPLIWIAARHGMVGSTLAALVIQGAVIVTGELAGHEALTVFELQALLIALTVIGLFLGVTVDERRRAEEELRTSMRMAAAGEMAAALAHELNQPLAALSSYARASQLLAQAEGDRRRLDDTLGKMVAEAQRAAEVVRRLRDFFRTGATRLTAVSLADVGGRVVASLRERAEGMGVALEQHVPQPVPALLVDEIQMEVVIRNLVANALEAAAAREGEGRRAVRVEMGVDARGDLRTTVVDTGGGVDPADAPRLFEPFVTTRATGMGMGLAISRAIVEAHGGRLWVEPGARGVFHFTLPAANEVHA
jgi:two-component system sensor kinase FixL